MDIRKPGICSCLATPIEGIYCLKLLHFITGFFKKLLSCCCFFKFQNFLQTWDIVQIFRMICLAHSQFQSLDLNILTSCWLHLAKCLMFLFSKSSRVTEGVAGSTKATKRLWFEDLIMILKSYSSIYMYAPRSEFTIPLHEEVLK